MIDSFMGPRVPSHSTVLIKLFLKVCDADAPMLRKFMGGS